MVILKNWLVIKTITALEYGDYRIIYTLYENNLTILVTKAANRGQVYK